MSCLLTGSKVGYLLLGFDLESASPVLGVGGNGGIRRAGGVPALGLLISIRGIGSGAG